MGKRHLFERESQQEALQEFDALARIKELVDWEAFRPRLEQVFGTGGASRRRGGASVLGCAGDVPGTAVGCDAWIE